MKLQTEKEKGRGFVPLAKFETTVGDIVCYRCWGMRHHNKLLKAEVHDLSVIEKVRAHSGKHACAQHREYRDAQRARYTHAIRQSR